MHSLTAGQVSCPTATKEVRCSTCIVPMCLTLSTHTIPCGCPSTLPTSTISHACSAPCVGGCGVEHHSVLANCSATRTASITTSRVTKSGCPTITSTVLPSGCTLIGPPGQSFCSQPACVTATSVTVPCSCVPELPVKTTTVTGECTCRSGCLQTTNLLYLPCPHSPPPTLSTSVTTAQTTTATSEQPSGCHPHPTRPVTPKPHPPHTRDE